MKNSRILSPVIFSVSHVDMLDLWIETLHPNDHVAVIWDAKNHIEILQKSGFALEKGSLYNNKVLTIVLDDVRDCFYVMDVLDSYEDNPYIQIYSEGVLLTDNLENLRAEITN
mgnify:CR=1 FL=1|jgi:hypothetical protein|tara:strand:- start:1951 stop:2289 length:339 start_codon:yes stop_codon:yes gene_type:complete